MSSRRCASCSPIPRGDDATRACQTRAKVEEEFGDLLFRFMANVARHLDIDPEAPMRGGPKFIRRLQYIEQSHAAAGKTPEQSSLAEMDDLLGPSESEERK